MKDKTLAWVAFFPLTGLACSRAQVDIVQKGFSTLDTAGSKMGP